MLRPAWPSAGPTGGAGRVNVEDSQAGGQAARACRPGQASAASGASARPGGPQHHGVLQGLQCCVGEVCGAPLCTVAVHGSSLPLLQLQLAAVAWPAHRRTQLLQAMSQKAALHRPRLKERVTAQSIGAMPNCQSNHCSPVMLSCLCTLQLVWPLGQGQALLATWSLQEQSVRFDQRTCNAHATGLYAARHQVGSLVDGLHRQDLHLRAPRHLAMQ